MKKNALKPLRDNKNTVLYHVDGLSVAQGPNYALAKRLQHWRAQVSFEDGYTVASSIARNVSLSLSLSLPLSLLIFFLRMLGPIKIKCHKIFGTSSILFEISSRSLFSLCIVNAFVINELICLN